MVSLYLSTSFFIFVVACTAFVLCYIRACLIERGEKLHSQPSYYAWWAFLLVLLSGLGVYAVCCAASNVYISHIVKQDLQAQLASGPPLSAQQTKQQAAQLNAHLANVKAILQHGSILKALPENVAQQDPSANLHATVQLYNIISKLYSANGINLPLDGDDLTAVVALNANKLKDKSLRFASIGTTIFSMFICLLVLSQTKQSFRARQKVESIIVIALQATAAFAIITTVAIVLSLLFQTISFFKVVPISDFLFGTVWDPRFAAAGAEHSAGQFGVLPLLMGTLYIAFMAMLVAVPIGLFAAIYMSEYASARLRFIIKPLLEILAGIPTIVYGFFAAFTVGPFLRDLSAMLNGGHSFILAQSVFTAGLAIGIMLIPFVSSLSDDILSAVPNALRDCSYGLGATKSETIKKVVLPAALPGIVGALLLSASRAIGETMIVVLAAGVAANLTLNPFQAMTTITVKIVSQLTGDLEFDSPQTLVAFALGMILFVFTLLMNVFALYIVRKYREQYE